MKRRRSLLASLHREDFAAVHFPCHEHAAVLSIAKGTEIYSNFVPKLQRGPSSSATLEKIGAHAFEAVRVC